MRQIFIEVHWKTCLKTTIFIRFTIRRHRYVFTIVADIFCIHYFSVWSIFKFLIATVFFAHLSGYFSSAESQFHGQLRIWIFSYRISEREVILRILTHLFPIHHFLVGSIVKYLISGKVLIGCFNFCHRNGRTVVFRNVVNTRQGNPNTRQGNPNTR